MDLLHPAALSDASSSSMEQNAEEFPDPVASELPIAILSDVAYLTLTNVMDPNVTSRRPEDARMAFVLVLLLRSSANGLILLFGRVFLLFLSAPCNK